MGYSLSVRFKNEKEQNEMYQFYTSNKDIVEAMSAAEGRNDAEYFTDLNFSDGLSYAPRVKHLLGYDGPSGRPYYFELLLAWMSVKSTYRDKTNEPFMYYDNEKIKVNKKNGLGIEVQENGIQSFDKSMSMLESHRSLKFNLYQLADFEQYFKKLNVLFNTLEDRWQEFQLTKEQEKTKKIKP